MRLTSLCALTLVAGATAFAGFSGTAAALSLPPAVPGTVINTTASVTGKPAVPVVTTLSKPVTVMTGSTKSGKKTVAKKASHKKVTHAKVTVKH